MTRTLHTDTGVREPRPRMNRERSMKARLVRSTRSNARIGQTVTVEYNPNRIAQTIKQIH